MILAGDIGGTKTHLALFQGRGKELCRHREKVFPSADFATFDAVVEAFLSENHQGGIESACFGVAGPVQRGVVETTNLPWRIDASALGKKIDCDRVSLLNDLQAAALGMLQLGPSEMVELNPGGESRSGPIAVIAAGTGTGEAILHWDGRHYRAIATEGGHTDFGPGDEQQDALLRFLRRRYGGHVSYERILSGEGLYNIYLFLKASGFAEQTVALEEVDSDPSAVISRMALEGRDDICMEALRLFVRIYGAEAGNLALKCFSTGGVFVGGGIALKILPVLQSGGFMAGFLDKGRFGEVLKTFSVKVSLNPDTALLGAARFAFELL